MPSAPSSPALRRVSIVGCSGSGKTTLGKKLAERLGVPYIQLDELYHQPGWTPTPRDELRKAVASVLEAETWVVDGNYSSLVQDLVWAPADTVVWLDLSRSRVMTAVIWRTLTRGALRRELFNGNRESLRSLFRRDPEENIVLWSWTQWPKYRKQYENAVTDPANSHLTFLRLKTRKEIHTWLGTVEPAS
jgi:adenylate kinase family enzyme